MPQPTLPRRLDGVSHILAVASGKGGVGKTTVAVNLALALRREGARVGLFDADLYGPNVPLLLGLRRPSAVGKPVAIPVARTAPTPYIPPLERFGLKVMSFGLVLGEADTIRLDASLAGRMASRTLRDVLWGELDFLLLDLPPGTGEPQQTLLHTTHMDGVLLVTTPQDLALMDTGRSLGLFQQANVPLLGYIENMSSLHCPHCHEPIDVFNRSERVWAVGAQVPLPLARIPLEQALSRSIDPGHPLMQATLDSPGALAFRELAAQVIRKFA